MNHRRGTSRRRRGSGSKTHSRLWAHAFAIALVLEIVASGTPVGASPIYFENPPAGDPGHFEWFGGTAAEPIGLDIGSSAASQTGDCGGVACFAQYNELPNWDRVVAPPGGGLEVGGYADYFLIGAAYGGGIPSGADWRDVGYVYHPAYGSWLPEGEEAYLGIAFPLVDGGPLHYGWIGVEKFVADDGSHQLDAFGWGYEDEPGAPIQGPLEGPEPGTLTTLAFGAAAVAARRRR